MQTKTTQTKLNGQSLKNASEILNRGGAVASSDWTTGSGNYISKRPIPCGCVEIEVSQISTLKGVVRKSAEKLLKSRPRLQKMIVVSDLRAVKKALKS